MILCGDGRGGLCPLAPPAASGEQLAQNLLNNPQVLEATAAFKMCPTVAVGAAEGDPDSLDPSKELDPVLDGGLYVGQGEYCIIEHFGNAGKFRVVGTDDATTCLMVCMHAKQTGLVFLAHIGSKEEVAESLDAIEGQLFNSLPPGSPGSQVDVVLAGGFDDERGLSEETLCALLSWMHARGAAYNVTVACVWTANNEVIRGVHGGRSKDDGNRPIVRGIAAKLESNRGPFNPSAPPVLTVAPAYFTKRGPVPELRGALCYSTSNASLRPVYRRKDGMFTLRVPRFIAPYHENLDAVIDILKRGEPHSSQVLSVLSTSPFAERARFVPDTARSLECWRGLESGRGGYRLGDSLAFRMRQASCEWDSCSEEEQEEDNDDDDDGA